MCKCMEELQSVRETPTGNVCFIPTGDIMNMDTGEHVYKPVLYAVKLHDSGNRTLTQFWYPVKYCPNCGEKVDSWA